MTSSSACCVTRYVTVSPTVLMAVMRPTAVPSFQVQVRSALGWVLSDPSAGWTPPWPGPDPNLPGHPSGPELVSHGHSQDSAAVTAGPTGQRHRSW